MNKAFIREPEEPDPRCPRCAGPGQSVGRPTLLAHLPPDTAARLSETSYYCPNPRCGVAYFDGAGQEASVSEMRAPAYPKDPNAPICSCFGVTPQQIESDARQGEKSRIRELLAKANAPDARCTTLAPNGRSCARRFNSYS